MSKSKITRRKNFALTAAAAIAATLATQGTGHGLLRAASVTWNGGNPGIGVGGSEPNLTEPAETLTV